MASSSLLASLSAKKLVELKKQVVRVLESCDGHRLELNHFKKVYTDIFKKKFETHYGKLKSKKLKDVMAALDDVISLEESGSQIIMKLKNGSRHRSAIKDKSSPGEVGCTAAAQTQDADQDFKLPANTSVPPTTDKTPSTDASSSMTSPEVPTIATPVQKDGESSSGGKINDRVMLKARRHAGKSSTKEKETDVPPVTYTSQVNMCIKEENAGSAGFAPKSLEKPGATEDERSQGNIATVMSPQRPLSPVSAAIKVENLLPLSPPLQQQTVIGYGMQVPPQYLTGASGTTPSSPSLREIMDQQEREEKITKKNLHSPAVGYGRLLNEMGTPDTVKRTPSCSPPPFIDARVREVGQPGPFEKSINHAQNLMSTGKAKSRKTCSFQEVNKAAEDIIASLSEEGQFVSLEVVKAKLCKEFGKLSFREFNFKKENAIPALHDLIQLQAKVSLFVHAYVMTNSIATLYELSQSLADLESKPDFEDLKLGPLLQQPVVYDMFKAPPGLPVPHITTIQILKHLERYMTEEDLWRKKVDLKKFLEYLCEQHDCDTPYKLGIRIQSVGLAISVIKQAKKSDSERWKAVREQVSADMEGEIQRQMRKIKNDLLGKDRGDLRSCVMKFLDASPVDALNEIFNCSMDLFDGKRQQKITKFLTAITEDSLGRRLFQLTLYMSCKRLLGDALEHLVADEVEKRLANNVEKSQETETRPVPPSEGRVVEKAKEWLVNADRMDLMRLALIEERVVSKFPEFKSFEELGCGSFLRLLTSHKELVEAIEQVGGLARSGGMGTVLGRQLSLNSVLEFISQCGAQTSHETIERNLCSYYGVIKAKDLGFGSCSNLLKKAEDRPRINTPSVVYEAALFCHDPGAKGSSASEEHNGGVLGYMSKEDAIAAIRSTPLLEDVALWTHWDEVFGGDVSKLGDLKSFFENEGILISAGMSSPGIHGPLVVMETSPGVLLRVTANTSPEIFKECACRGDTVGAAGHLVSMVMVNGGVANTPVALLSNHVQSSLAAMACYGKDGYDRRSEFVLQCLVRMPRRLAQTVGTKVFLEPLKKVVGSTEAPSLLLTSCVTQFQRSRLHQLGFALGISQWIEDFRSRVSCGKEENLKLVALQDEERKRPIAVFRPVASSNEQINQISEDSVTVLEIETAISLSEASNNVRDEEIAVTSDADNNFRTQSTSHVSSTEQEEECRAVIEQIRREDFGIGLELGEEESKLVQRQREREGRGLHRLSTELYSRDTHFVLELVQNADDNSYPQDSCDPVFPSLVFVLEQDKIVVLNNEVGFTEKNIRALCDVGRSTKGAHRYGYIGQKGIGFKSVFRVSDCPEVHSNGYHIRFDAKSGPIGYILPQWIEEGCGEEQRCKDQVEDTSEEKTDEEVEPVRTEDDGWPTRIVLPLKEEYQGMEKSSLAARFRDVHPSLLLFLHRLRAISIQDKVNNINRDMIRKDLGHNIMEVSHTNGTDRWLVIKKQLDASNVKEDVELTELALAFPLFSDSDSDQETSFGRRHQTLPPQNVFAYLPLRSYGFRFIIQGDFEVPSSREDVDGDKSWNQWLREEIPQLFIDALSVFMEHSSFPGLSSVASYFQFVPLEEEILDFFTPVARHILMLLKGKPCIPVKMSGPETEQPSRLNSYDWVLPCKAIFCQDSTTQQLVTPALLEEHLGLQYLHPDISPALNPTLKSRLGIETLSSKHLIEIGKAEVKKISAEGSATVSDGDDRRTDVTRIAWLAQWLQCMYRSLEQERNSSQDMLDLIRSLNVIPLTNGTFVDLKGDAVFLPLSMKKVSEGAVPKKKKSPNVTSQEQTYFSVLERDLSTVHPALFSSLDDIGRTQVEQLLRRLGVKCWSARDLINGHIMPTFISDKWKAKSIEVLRSYLVYILDQRLRDPSVCDINELRSCVQILTNKGALNPAQTPIHFTPKFGNTIDLARELPSISWTLVDESYLDSFSGSKARITDWKTFLAQLGLQHFLAIKKKQVKLHRNSMAQTPWASFEPVWQTTPDGLYIIDDWACEEFEEFLSKIVSQDAKLQVEEFKVLAQCIDERWENEYSQYADGLVNVKDSNGHNLTETHSSFYLNLVSKPWMSASDGTTSCFSRDLFMRSEWVYRLLENHVKYTAADLKNNAFISTLRIGESVSVDGMISEMKKWSTTSGECEEESQAKEFTTSVAHMSKVYSFLHQNMMQCKDERRKINDAFHKNALIFVPVCQPESSSKQLQAMHQLPGMFYSKKDVCWRDPTDVASKLLKGKVTTRRLLQGFYHSWPKSSAHESLASFFVDELNVDETPNVDEYIEMASTVAEVAGFPTPLSLTDMLKIFAILGKKCVARGHNDNIRTENEIDVNMASFIKRSLETEQKCIFPTSEKWVSLSDKPLLADNKSLVKIFQKEKSVHFLDLGNLFELQKQRSTSVQRMSEQEREEMKHYVSLFLKTCEVKPLSECIAMEFIPTFVQYQCVPLQKYFHQLIPSVQRFLHSKNPTVYRELNNKRFAQKLLQMQFASVKSLETVYSLSTHQDVRISVEERSGVQTASSSFCLYVVQEHQENADVLNIEMVKLLLGGKKQGSSELSNFLVAVKSYSGSDPEFFLEEVQNLEPLPDEEELWCVPAPEEPEIVEVEEEASAEVTPSLNIDSLKPSRASDDGLHSWPPKSATQYDKTRKHEAEPSNENTLTMWPPPAPPDSMKKSLEEQVQGRQTQRDVGTGKPNELEHVTQELVERVELLPRQHNTAPVMRAVSEETTDQTNLQDNVNPTIEDRGIKARVLEECPPNGKENSVRDETQVGPPSPPKAAHGDIYTPADPADEARQISSAHPHLWFDEQASELEYEDLSFNGDIKILDAIPLVENPNKEEIGRWGEQCVYEFLLNQAKLVSSDMEVEIVWKNEKGNTTAPYDFEIRRRTDAHSSTVITYVEVKTTSSDQKEVFEISVPELKFALAKKEALHLYRVYNAGKPSCLRIRRLQNLAAQLERKNVKLCMMI